MRSSILCGAGLVAIVASQMAFADPFTQTTATAGQSKPADRMNCGAQIECMTPDGHAGHVSKLPANDPNATALIMEDDTVSCLLQEGETNFVIELPRSALLDRFTFLNENASARGELRISVSNRRLSPNSPEWKDVEGVVPFAHKRLFGVSLLGIEAKYVRLSFRVEKEAQISARVNLVGSDRQLSDTSVHFNKFDASALDQALNSQLPGVRTREPAALVSYMSPSVAPLSASVSSD